MNKSENIQKENIIKAKFIIIWHENQHKLLKNGYISFKDNEFTGYGNITAPENHDNIVIDLGDSLITPGFINLHCHPAAAPFEKSYREDCGNLNFYQSTLFDRAMVLKYSEEEAAEVARFSLNELLLSGCTTVVIPENIGNVVNIAGSLGFRAYIGAHYRSSISGIPWRTEDGHSIIYSLDDNMSQLQQAIDFIKKYNGSYEGRIHTLLAPTQTTTCTYNMLKETRKIADSLGVGITIHAAEDLNEFRECLKRYGKTPIQLLYDVGLLEPDVLLAHTLFLTGHSQTLYPGDEDIILLSESGASIAHCPWVLLRKGTSFMESYPRYLKRGINVGIGTDTFPFDFIQEMRYAAVMGKMMEHNTLVSTAGDVFNSATIRGAKALNRADLGKIAPGSKADFVSFNLNSFEMTPIRDPLKNLIYSSTRHSIDQVYIDGKCLVKNGKVIGQDEKMLAERVQKIVEKAWLNTNKYDWKNRNVDQISPLTFPTYK